METLWQLSKAMELTFAHLDSAIVMESIKNNLVINGFGIGYV